MKFVLIDYSEIYFKQITKKPVPSEKGGRFIQLRNEDEDAEYMILSPSELSSFHANIVERFCLLRGIDGQYTNKRKDNFEILDPAWEIVGGGKWMIDSKKKEISFFGVSGVYGRFDPGNLKKNVHGVGSLSAYTIRVNGG